MPRKAKKRMHEMPPLSFLDKLIYWTAFVLLCVAYGALVLGPMYLRNQIAFSNPAVIAAIDHFSTMWLMVPWLTFFLMTFLLWHGPYQKRIPIFGKRNFKYGPPAWPKIYPLFMKDKPHVWVSERAKKDRKRLAVILLIILLISFIPLPWSLYGRDCLRNDGSIVQYNMFNRETDVFTSGDIADLEIEAYRYTTGKYASKAHYGVRLIFRTDSGEKFIFAHRDFRSDREFDTVYWLEWMLRIIERYDPGIIHCDGQEKLDRVITDRALSQKEVQKLYQLFGQL